MTERKDDPEAPWNKPPQPIKELWIIEAPGKARVLHEALKRLGMEARVFATKGHLMSFPDRLTPVGIDARLREVERKAIDPARVVRMRAEAASAARVVVATDADQEGDVIAWDVADILSDIHPSPLRVRLRGMDDESILQAADEGGPVLIEDAVPGRTRAILDRLIGATYSRNGIAVGRVGTAILGLFRPGQPDGKDVPTTMRLRLCAPAADNGKPWMADTSVQQPLDAAMAERLRELQLPRLSKRGGEPGRRLPGHTGDILARAADVLDLSPGETMRSLQRSYESGRMSYPRSGSRGISETVSQRLDDMLRKAGQKFDSDAMARKTGSDVHDAPHPIGPPPNLSISPTRMDVDESVRAVVAGDLVRAGQVHVIEEPDTTPLAGFLEGRGFPTMVIELVLSLRWRREQGPRYPGQQAWGQSETFERHPAAVLMERVVETKLGRPSTWASQVDGFLSRGLVDSELALTAKGIKWMEASPVPLLDFRISAAIERACTNMSLAKGDPEALPWENMAMSILGILARTPLKDEVMATAALLPSGNRIDPWAGMRQPMDVPSLEDGPENTAKVYKSDPNPEVEADAPRPPDSMFPGEL